MHRSLLPAVVALVAAFAGCTGGDDAPDDVDAAATFSVTSSAFADGGAIPRRNTCDDPSANTSPPLSFRGLPSAARTLAMIMDDPDAPLDHAFVHWVFWNLPSTAINLGESADVAALGGTMGANERGENAYRGPCPPTGTHEYHFKVYALDGTLGLEEGSNKGELLEAMEGRVLARGELVGTYVRG